LLADLIGGVASMAAILIWPHSYPVLWLGSIGIGLSIASLYPTTIAFAGSRMAITGRVTGWFFVGSGAGGMILPWLIGQLFEPVGPHVAMLAILADLILAIGILSAILVVSSKTAMTEKTA
jgi:fucose permease